MAENDETASGANPVSLKEIRARVEAAPKYCECCGGPCDVCDTLRALAPVLALAEATLTVEGLEETNPAGVKVAARRPREGAAVRPTPEEEAAVAGSDAADLDAFQAETIAWARRTFPTTTVASTLTHLVREINGEVIPDPSDVVEWADCYLLLMNAAAIAGHTPSQIIQAARQKAKINYARQWAAPDAEGVVEHVRAPVCGRVMTGGTSCGVLAEATVFPYGDDGPSWKACGDHARGAEAAALADTRDVITRVEWFENRKG